jgi:uncharacterized hydrophobic protein (TIGR00271 family)
MKSNNDIDQHKESVRESIRNNSVISFDYVVMNTLSAIIASYGLFANSPAVVIGAMIVAMLLNPILGVSLALVDSNVELVKKAMITLGVGIFCIMGTAFFIGNINSNIVITNEIMARTAPNLLDLMIALAGGAAGAYAAIAPRLSAAFVGVAIATALVPPLASSSILLARGEYHLASGAFLLAFTNIVAIQSASSAVMWFTGFRRVVGKNRQAEQLQGFLKNELVSLLILIALTLTLTANFRDALSKQLFESEVHRILVEEIETPSSFNELARIKFEKLADKLIIRATVRGVNPLTPAQITAIEARLPTRKTPIELRIRFVHITVTNREGILSDIELGAKTLEN